MTIIGLGNTGCNIAEKFENTSDFKVLLIDSNIEGESNCISIQEQISPEDYEKNFPDISDYIKNIDNEIYLIIGGSGKISGSSLSLLKQLKQKEIHIVYIRPDQTSLSGNSKLQDKLVFNVMQEYARSGIFKSCILISNSNIEKILGEVPIIGYFDIINNVIYDSLLNIILLNRKKPLLDNITPVKEYCRIRTIGIYNSLNKEEELFYNFNYIDDKYYYFVMNEENLKKDSSLLKKIKECVLEETEENVNSSYAIFSTKDNKEYCYVDVYSRRIQE